MIFSPACPLIAATRARCDSSASSLAFLVSDSSSCSIVIVLKSNINVTQTSSNTYFNFLNCCRNASEKVLLTHICQMDLSILIIWRSPFQIVGVSGEHYHFYLILDRKSLSKQCRPWSDAVFCCDAAFCGLHCVPRSQNRDTRLWVKM